MNRVFRIVWSYARGAWVVVSDLAKRRTKCSSCDKRRTAAQLTAPASWMPLASLLIALPAGSADLYWDPNGNTAGRGGAGTWNTTGSFWTANPDGTTGPFTAWSNAALDIAIFGDAVPLNTTVTLATPITVGGITFETTNYTIAGSTLTLGGAAPTVRVAGGQFASISSDLAGTNGLRLEGGGVLTLRSTGNSLTGGIDVVSGQLVANAANTLAGNVVDVGSSGQLMITDSNAFGGDTSAANLVMHGGSTLYLGNANLTHDITATGGTIFIQDPFDNGIAAFWNGTLNLTADTTLAVTGTDSNTTFSGNLSDTGANRLSLLDNSSDRLILSGDNTFTGGITVNGRLQLSGANSAGAATNVVTVNGGGVLEVRDHSFRDTDAADLVINDGGTMTVVAGTFTHDVTLTGGTANVTGATWNGSAALTADSTLNLSGVTLAGTLSDNGGVLSLQSQGSHLTGDLSFSGDFTIASGNTWFDSGTHTYTGDTVITGGALLLNSATTLSPNTNIRFEGVNTAPLGSSVIYLTNSVPNFTLPVGAGAGQVSWSGSGGFVTLAFNADATVNLFGDGRTVTWGAGDFVPDGEILILGSNTTNAGARQVDFQNGIDLNGAVRAVRADNGNRNDHVLLSGVLSGTGGLQLIGNGAIELTNTNTYSGATVVGDNATDGYGTLILGGAGVLSANTNLQINGTGDAQGFGSAGVVILTTASGDFTRALGTGAGQVQWTGSGGFGALGGDRTVNIGGAGATLAWGAGGFVQDGDALRFDDRFSDSAIDWANGLNLGAADRVINVMEHAGPVAEVRLNGVIEGAGGLSLLGTGDVELNALNSFTGALSIGIGSAAVPDNTMFAYANTVADAGVASSLGAGNTVILASHQGGLIYTGGAASSNRTLQLRDNNGSTLNLFNRGTGRLEWTGGVDVGTAGAQNVLLLGGTYATADANGDGISDAPNVLSGVMADGSGTLRVEGSSGNCGAGNVWRLAGASTFTGGIGIGGCVFEVTTLADGGAASSIGASSNSELNLDLAGNGTLRYIGAGDSTDRLLRPGSNGYIESSGTGPLAFTNTGFIVPATTSTVVPMQWLGGTNTADNTFALTLVDSATPVEYTSRHFSLGKTGPGLWALVTDSNAQTHAYTGNTRIEGGALRLDDAGAITGGLGATSSHGTAGSNQRSSLVVFEGLADGSAGVLGLTAASGGFSRGVTAENDAFLSNQGTTIGADPDGSGGPLPAFGIEALDDDAYVQGVRWLRSGGFAAWDGVQSVNLFRNASMVTWGANGFVPDNHNLVFGYQTADGTVDFRNSIDLGGASRTFEVRRGLADTDAMLSGALTGTGTAGIVKTGDGVLALTANNNFSGDTLVAGGVLQLGDGGTTGDLGASAQVVLSAGTTLAANRSDAALLLNSVTDGAGNAGTFEQRGTGTTTIAANSDVEHIAIDAGKLVTFATMLTTDVTFSDGGGAALDVKGTLQTSGGTATAVTGGILGDSVIVSAGGNAMLAADLGDGADLLDVGGGLNAATTFALGAGDDTFTIRDNALVTGTVDGGAGVDTLNTAVAGVATLGSAQSFETLTKTGVGLLNVTGPAAFDTVNVQQGTLDVNTGAAITAVTTTVSAGATLAVHDAYNGTASNDTFTIAGAANGTGLIGLLGGDDQLIIQDGVDLNSLTNALDGGTHATADTIVLDSAAALTVDLSRTTNFEHLTKQNAGTATVTGTQSFDLTSVDGGTLIIADQLETPTVAIADGATFEAAGTAQNAGATALTLTGSTGANTVRVASGGTLLGTGDLGDGADVVSVAGTLDTLGANVQLGADADVLDVAGTLELGGGTAFLGDGDDTFTIHDGTVVNGTVDGGAGLDTRLYNINASADLGALVNFEGLTKTGAGVLNVNGPGNSSLAEVEVQGGTLNVAAGGSIDAAMRTVVASGTTLQVDGAYTGTTGADTFTLSGTVAGANDVQLGAGDDLLTLREGAVLTSAVDGGAETAGDTLALDIATTSTFDGANATSFEVLAKQNAGTATLTNTQSYAATRVEGGTLDVDGILETATVDLLDGTTLNIDGTTQASGAAQTVVTGSAGDNTLRIGSTGTLITSGGLGDGADTLDVLGALDAGGGTFDLGDGDDTFVVHDGTSVTGTVVGGAGTDSRVYDLVGTADVGALQGFEGLVKRNAGTLNINGPAVTTDLLDVQVEGGLLNIGAGAQIAGVQATAVASGAALNVDGAYGFTAGADTFSVAGAVSGLGTFDMLDGDDALTLFDGADLSGLAAAIEGGAGTDTLTAHIDTSGRLGGAIGFETLIKEGAGTLHIDGPASSMFDTVLLREGVLHVAAGVLVDPKTTEVDAGTTFLMDGTYQGTADADTFTLSGTLAGVGATDLLDGDDLLTINTGADVTATGPFDAGDGSADRLVLSGAASDSFDLGLIDTVFQNFEQFRKEGTGTWRLTGAGDHDWTVAAGTLIGDTTSFGGNIDNAGTVVFDQAADGTYAGVLSGSGNLIKQQGGTLILAADQPFNGSTRIENGALQVDAVLPSAITVATGGVLSGIGRVSALNTSAGGSVSPGNAADPFGTLTIAGDYTGGGRVNINTVLGNETSATSKLVIQGSTSDTSSVLINPMGGDGVRTAGDGIQIIQVDGASAADSFRLAQPVQGGAYEYLLYQGGSADANDWYLRSQFTGPGPEPEPEPEPSVRPGVPGYVLGHQASLEYGFTALDDLRLRVGTQGRALDADGASDVWVRASAHELDVAGTRFSAEDLQMSMLQLGADVYGSETQDGGAHFGAMISLGQMSASFVDPERAGAALSTRAGDVESDVAGVGLYWTVYGDRGGYLSLSAQALNYRNRYTDQYTTSGTQRGWGATVSAEIGAAYALGSSNWKIEPQLQVGYQQLALEEFADEVSSVSAMDEDAVRARAGVQLFRTASDWLGMRDASPYVGVGVQKDLVDAESIVVGTTAVSDRIPETTVDATVGFAGSVGTGFELHLDARYQQATEGEKDGVRANFGFRKRF